MSPRLTNLNLYQMNHMRFESNLNIFFLSFNACEKKQRLFNVSNTCFSFGYFICLLIINRKKSQQGLCLSDQAETRAFIEL